VQRIGAHLYGKKRVKNRMECLRGEIRGSSKGFGEERRKKHSRRLEDRRIQGKKGTAGEECPGRRVVFKAGKGGQRK